MLSFLIEEYSGDSVSAIGDSNPVGCSLPACSEANRQIATGCSFFIPHEVLSKPPPHY